LWRPVTSSGSPSLSLSRTSPQKTCSKPDESASTLRRYRPNHSSLSSAMKASRVLAFVLLFALSHSHTYCIGEVSMIMSRNCGVALAGAQKKRWLVRRCR
jgi:hypothetical protein